MDPDAVSLVELNNSRSSAVNQAAQLVVQKLRAAVARVRYVQFVASFLIFLIVLVIVIGSALGEYTSGANPNAYFALTFSIRVLEILYAFGVAVFLAS